MPELPEVEIARENLERWLLGRTIVEARVVDRRVLGGQKRAEVERTLNGARVTRVRRRGKYLIWELVGRGEILAHLGMSGKFVLRQDGAPEPPAVCVALGLGDGRRLLYSDVRRFGRFQLLRRAQKGRVGSLGVEPLEAAFTPAFLAHLILGVGQPIKPFLLNQRRIAGLGNIYATEALFRAGIHPARPAGRLSKGEVKRLHKAIRATLQATLALERGPEITYLEESEAENLFFVYGREGEPCPRCRARVRRVVQAGRSSFYCPHCQKKYRRKLSHERRSVLPRHPSGPRRPQRATKPARRDTHPSFRHLRGGRL